MARKNTKAQLALEGQNLFVEKEALARMVETCVGMVLEEELTRYLGAEPYERGAGRRGHRNGSKPRTMKTTVGQLRFDVPQARQGGFRPSVFERYQRSDKALVAAMQEMVVQGVSTRRVGAVLDRMADFDVSAATVSRAMGELDEQIERWRNRPLGADAYPYLIIDARYEKVRQGGRVRSQAVLIVAGINEAGRREMLGYWLGDSESEATWSEALVDLKRRGLRGVELIVSDAHKGIRKALERHFQGAAWQRCRVHLMREMLNKVSWRDRKQLAADLKAIFVSDSREQCMEVAREVCASWESRAPRMTAALAAGVEDSLTVQAMPRTVRRRLHSTNMLERQMRELKRRTRVVSIFPGAAACERLYGALLIETDEAWLCEPRRYVTLERD